MFSDEKRFVVGTYNGMVSICNDKHGVFQSQGKFKNSDFAIGREESKLHILSMILRNLKVVDYEFNAAIWVLVASDSYVAVGDESGCVTIFNHDGDLLLVSYKKHFEKTFSEL